MGEAAKIAGFHQAALRSVRPIQQRGLLAVTDGNQEGSTSSSSTSRRQSVRKGVDEGAELEHNSELEFECGVCGEETTSKALKTPFKPTQRMIDDHNISHIPFRDRCAACVRGRGKSQKHRLQDKAEDLYPVISMDYGFFGTDEQVKEKDIGSTKLPILVVKDRRSKAIWAHPVPEKGAEDPYAFNCLVRDLDDTGYKRIILKDDQEPAIKAVGQAAKVKWKGEIVPEQSPKRESKSNGEVERAVQEVQGMARTLKEALEQRLGAELRARTAILAWLVEYGATLYTLFRRGEDGMTPIQRLKGRTWKIELPEFAETVELMKRTKHKLAARWEEGIYLGIKLRTSEKIVGTRNGIFVVQSLRRKPLEDRWNADLVTNLCGVPWNLNKGEIDVSESSPELPYPLDIKPEVTEVPNVAAEANEAAVHFRRTYLTKKDLQKHGYTNGCPACAAISGGFDRAGLAHTEECRKRLEGKLKEEPEGNKRLKETDDRTHQRMAEYVGRVDKRDREERVDQPDVVPAAQSDVKRRKEEKERTQSERKRKAEDQVGDKGVDDEADVEMDALADREDDGPASFESSLFLLVTDWECVESTPVWDAIMEVNEIAANKDWHHNPDRPVAEERSAIDDISWNVGHWEAFFDTATGQELDAQAVKESMAEELHYMESLPVWRRVQWEAIPAETKVVKTKWVLTQKGCDVRARLVACEVKGADASEAHLFAATPPLDALRVFIALAACMPEFTLDFLDIRKAHLNGASKRCIAIHLPKEAGGGYAILDRTLYGTRDAAAAWEECIYQVLSGLGFERGRSCPCLYYCRKRNIRVLVHGDDFVILSSRSDSLWLRRELGQVWDVKERGALGYEVEEIQILGRWVRRHSGGYSLEADPKHADILIHDAGLNQAAKGVAR